MFSNMHSLLVPCLNAHDFQGLSVVRGHIVTHHDSREEAGKVLTELL
jgi:hypothetical protein